MSEQKTFKELNARESEIWAHLDDVCEEETLEEIAELIELNLELEKISNQ